MPAYKHLFFDLDHTLWDFDTNAKYSLSEIYGEFNLDKNVTPVFDDFYQKYIYHNEILWDRYQKGFITADELKWRRMWRTLLDFKIGDEELAKKLSSRFLEILPVQKAVFPHTIEILEYLTEKKYQVHLITNGFEKTQWSKIRNSGLDRFITHMITSEASNSLKPKKEIFDYALNKAGASLKESIMIGDNLEADIQGAMNAGIDTVFVNHINAVTDIKPTYTVTHLQQLEAIF
ncbi:MAG: YjjG family noncanonical pyrimidine nucleotidase [Bacteroidetes bacterium]|nr:YjjG family noncanonical pyrimidine nucleotidase [Bacteroidota bacterium]